MERGFTLIEIVMVIILLAIVAVVAIPRFIDFSGAAKVNVTKQKMEVLRKGIVGDPSAVAAGTYSSRGYRGDVGAWPPDLDALRSKPGAVSAWDRYSKKGWNGPYVDENTTFNDGWDNAIFYNGSTAVISYGPDEVSGGGDDISVRLNY